MSHLLILAGVGVLAATAATIATPSAPAPAEPRAAQAASPKGGEPAGPQPHWEPNTSDGKPILQLGMAGIEAGGYAPEWALADIAMMMGNDWAAERHDGPAMNYGELWTSDLIDKTTNLPRAIPNGFTHIRSGLFKDSRYYPEWFAGTYVVEWEGDADIRFGFGLRQCPQRTFSCQQRVADNRLEATFVDTDRDWTNLQITRIGKKGLRNLRIYRKEHETEARAGALSPHFKRYARGYKIIRVMDVQSPVVSDIRSVDRLRKPGQFGYGSKWVVNGLPPDATAGAPLSLLFKIAMQTDAALWMTVPPLIGAPTALDAYYLGSPRQNEIKDAAKALFSEIMSSPEHLRFADATVKALIESGYPENRVLYVERSNEAWNFAHPFWWNTNYFHGIALGAKNPVGIFPSFGVGYMAAHDAVQLQAALDEAGRPDQAWVIVLAAQMANTETTRGIIAGFKKYFADRNLDAARYLPRAGVSTASYYNGTFSRTGLIKAADDASHKAAWLESIAKDPIGLQKRVADFVISAPASQAESLANLVALRQKHQAMAEAAGMFFLGDYEGESHEFVPEYLAKDPEFKSWIESFRRGPHQARLTSAWIDALRAQNPDAVIANYRGVSMGAPAADHPLASPWDDGFYEEKSGRRDAMAPYMRK